MEQDPKYTKALYDQLSNKLDLGTPDDFAKKIGTDDTFRKAVYEQAGTDLDLGDYSTFESNVKKKESPSDYGLPSKQAFADVFGTVSNEDLKAQYYKPYATIPPAPDETITIPPENGFKPTTPESLTSDYLEGKVIPRASNEAKMIGEKILSVPGEAAHAFGRLFDDIHGAGQVAEKGFAQLFLGKEGADAYIKARETTGVPNTMSLHPAEALSDFVSTVTQGVKEMPKKGVGWEITKGGLDILPDIAATTMFPEGAAVPLLSKLGVNIGKFGLEQAARGYMEGIKETQNQGAGLQLKMPVVNALEKGATGLMYEMSGNMGGGFGTKLANKLLPNAATTAELLNKAIVEHGTTTLTDGLTFGGLSGLDEYLRTGKISADNIATGFGMGIAFHGWDIGKLLTAKGLNTVLAMPAKGITDAAKSDMSVEELNKKADDKIALLESGQSENKEADATMAFMLKKAAQTKAVSEEVLNNPVEVKQMVKGSELPPKVQEEIKSKIEQVQADNDPRVQAAKPFTEQINKIDDQLKEISDDAGLSDGIKEIKSAPLREQKAFLKQQEQEAYNNPPSEEVKPETPVQEPMYLSDQTKPPQNIKNRMGEEYGVKPNPEQEQKINATKELYKTLPDGTNVYYVDVDQVRDIDKFGDFVEGGNGYAYPNFVPRDEIWIDNAFKGNVKRSDEIMTHEAIERKEMQDDPKREYFKDTAGTRLNPQGEEGAHVDANNIEKQVRDGEITAEDAIKKYYGETPKELQEPAKPEVAPEVKAEEPVMQEKKKTVKFKPNSETGKALNTTAGDFTDSVMQFFLSGGRMNRADFIRYSGWGEKDIKKSGLGFLLSKDGTRFDVFHQAIENSFGMENQGPMDMINAITDIMKTNPTRGSMLKAFRERHQEIDWQDAENLSPEERAKRELNDDIVIDEQRGELDDFIKQAGEDKDLVSAIRSFETEMGSGILDWKLLKDKMKSDPKFFVNNWLFNLNPAQIKRLNEILSSHGEQFKFEERLTQSADIEGAGEGNIVPERTEEPSGGMGETAGKEKPVRTTDPAKQKQIDAIDKEYDAKITDAQKELDGMTDEARRKVIAKAEKEVNRRNTLFGDANASENDLIKPGEQGFEVSDKPVKEALKKFDERKVELTKQIDALNKERESKIGEILKQQTLGFEEPEITKPNEEKKEPQPNIKVGTDQGNNIPAGTEPGKGGTTGKGETKPVAESKVEPPIVETQDKLNNIVSKYGWSTEKRPDGLWLVTKAGTPLVRVVMKGDSYTFIDKRGTKLMSGKGQIEKSAEKLLKNYYYAKEVETAPKEEVNKKGETGLQKNGDYEEKRSSSGMVKIYYKGEPVSSRRTLANTYEDFNDKENQRGIIFNQFVENHKNWLANLQAKEEVILKSPEEKHTDEQDNATAQKELSRGFKVFKTYFRKKGETEWRKGYVLSSPDLTHEQALGSLRGQLLSDNLEIPIGKENETLKGYEFKAEEVKPVEKKTPAITLNEKQDHALETFKARLTNKGGQFVGLRETTAGVVIDYKFQGDKSPRQATIFEDGKMMTGKAGMEKSSLYQEVDKLLKENSVRSKIAVDDLINKSKDIESLKELLDNPIVERDIDLPRAINTQINYLYRHPEIAETSPIETKSEELKAKEQGEKKIEVLKDGSGVKYGDKTYTDIVDVLDDIANGTINKEDGPLMREEINKWDEKNESLSPQEKIKREKDYRKSLIDKYKKGKGGTLPLSVTGLTKEQIELGGNLLASYVREGIYHVEDFINRLKEDFKGLGYNLNDKQIDELLDIKKDKKGTYREFAETQKTATPETRLAETLKSIPTKKVSMRDRLQRIKDAFDRSPLAIRKGEDVVWRNLESKLSNLKENIKAVWKAYSGMPEVTDYRRSLGDWSWAKQTNDKTLMDFTKLAEKKIPLRSRREAIVNYIEADGDMDVLKKREEASKKKFRQGYKDAQNLTPDEITIANSIKDYFDSMLKIGYDSGILKSQLENYVTHLGIRPDDPKVTKVIGGFDNGKLNTSFKYARKRIFDTYFDLEQAGFRGNKDFKDIIPAYSHSFNRAIYSRAFIKNLTKGKAEDGRPIIANAGIGKVTDDENIAEAVLVNPYAKPEEISDYKYINHPAFRDWYWATKAPDGTNVFAKGELVVHPDYYNKLSNILGKSDLMRSVPLRKIAGGVNITKQTIFMLSPFFHYLQEGYHALGHTVNPLWGLSEFDPKNTTHEKLIKGGLKLYDFNAKSNFAEGLASLNIASKIPIIKSTILPMQEYLFNEYIPKLKLTTAEHMVERNLKRYGKKYSEEQIYQLSASQANAAYGNLNYDLIGRNPTLQHIFRTMALAPDFLEARTRFAGQALTPKGAEQRGALLILGGTMFIAARLLNKLFDDDYHWDKPFSFIYKKNEYTLRSVPEDMWELYNDPRRFIYNRTSPLFRSVAVEGLTRRDYQGIPESTSDWLKSIVTSPMPTQITRMLPESWGKNPSDNKLWDDFVNTIGLRERHYFTPLEKDIRNLYYERNPRGKQSENQQNRIHMREEIHKLVENSTTPLSEENVKKITDFINDNVDKGKITLYQGQDLLDNIGGEDKDISVTMYNRLPVDDKIDLYNKMSDAEKKIYKMPKGVQDPYTTQLKPDNKELFNRLREFGGIKEIPEKRTIKIGDEKVDLSQEEVRKFNEEVVKQYGENVNNILGTDKEVWNDYKQMPDNKNPGKTKLQMQLQKEWDRAEEMATRNFRANYQSNK